MPVVARLPNSAEDFIEVRLDLKQHLVVHPAATFFVRVAGDSMVGAGIFSGDILIVDRALSPQEGSIVGGELTVKRLRQQGNSLWLQAENERYPPLEINEYTELQICGVVTNAIHSLRSN